MAAISSMRLFVVIFSPPEISFLNCPYMRTAPQPPGPGLPLHAPSVYITTFFNVSSLKIKLTLSPYRCYNHQGFTPKGHGVMVTRGSPKPLLRVRILLPLPGWAVLLRADGSLFLCRQSPRAARTSPSNRAAAARSLRYMRSGCHCTPRKKGRDASSTASITPSGARAHTRRLPGAFTA